MAMIQGKLDSLLGSFSFEKDAGRRIDFFSGQFLGAAYRGATLVGDVNTTEEFIVNLEAVDCITFIEYVEAMRLSNNYMEFRENLAKVRYRSGRVAFECRNHFFTDWKVYNAEHIDDATLFVGGQGAEKRIKTLNRKEDGGIFLPGIPVAEREVYYVPSTRIDGDIIGRLKTGDYIGIYSEESGLDASHAGIFINKASAFLRHASSSPDARMVVDHDFSEYISNKPGIIVLRPK